MSSIKREDRISIPLDGYHINIYFCKEGETFRMEIMDAGNTVLAHDALDSESAAKILYWLDERA